MIKGVRSLFRKKYGHVRVYSGMTYKTFCEGYDNKTGQFDKSKVKECPERVIYVTLESLCGYSRKWAVYLSQEYGDFPVVFSGVIDQSQIEYYAHNVRTILSGKIKIDRLYRINSVDSNFLRIKPEDNSFENDFDISDFIRTPQAHKSCQADGQSQQTP